MIRVLRLVLILALSFGAVIAPDVSSASAADMAMAQKNTTESADDRCDGCDPTGFSDGLPCEGACPVPCGSGGTAGIAIRTPSIRLAMPLGAIIPVAEPLIPLVAKPSVVPFPPRLPV